MIEIYHNPRCSKSREAVKCLEQSNIAFKIIKYLDQPPSYDELSDIIKKLGINPMELVRTNEAVWKENYKGKELSDKQLIQAMTETPKLIQRPIVINAEKAVVARPTDKIEKILKV